MGVNESSIPDTESSDESVYLFAEEGTLNDLNSASTENHNAPMEVDDGGQETDTNLPPSEEGTNCENMRHRDESVTTTRDNNTSSETTQVGLLNSSHSISSSTSPSMKGPKEVFTRNEFSSSMVVATPKENSDLDASTSKRGDEIKRAAIWAACQTTRKRNEIRHANGIPRPNGALTPIPSFRSAIAARATSGDLSTNKTNGKTSDVSVKTQPTAPLSPVLSEGSNTEVNDDGAHSTNGGDLPINLSPEKSWTFSALAPEFIPVPRSSQEIYENNVSGIPSHWVPLYGCAHGSFYDPATSMIVGDGHPRRGLERRDTTLSAQSFELQFVESMNYPPYIFDEFHHVQPTSSFTACNINAHTRGEGVLWFCTCMNQWSTVLHNCFISPDLPLPSGAIIPRYRLPSDWVYRDIPAVDTGYLDNNMAGYLGGGEDGLSSEKKTTARTLVRGRRW